jgi:hypothetical protein
VTKIEGANIVQAEDVIGVTVCDENSIEMA